MLKITKHSKLLALILGVIIVNREFTEYLRIRRTLNIPDIITDANELYKILKNKGLSDDIIKELIEELRYRGYLK